MKIKPLVWDEFPNGTRWLAVTPINTTYAIYITKVADATLFRLYADGLPVMASIDLNAVQAIAANHHRKHLMECFENAESTT
jgi:hypothetical protein